MDTDGLNRQERQENERMKPQIDADGRRGREAHTEARRHGGAEEISHKEAQDAQGDRRSEPQMNADGRR